MTTTSLGRPRTRASTLAAPWAAGALFAAFGLATLGLHLACAARYGYQRDELYFLACARHLAWGYVDQPPLIAAIAALSTALFGDSLQAIRLLPALAAAATVVLTGVFARRLGAGLFGMSVAMACVLVSPFFLYAGNLLTMNAFEPLLWTAAALIFVRILDGEAPVNVHWFALSAVVVLGILNKYTMLFFAGAVLVGTLAGPSRRVLLNVAPYAAAALSILIVSPNLWWQYAHGWPQIELLMHAAQFKNPPLTPVSFALQQILMMNPATLPVWAAGLAALVSVREGRYRAFAIAYALLLALFIALHGKIYYLASIYPLLFAAGAEPVERFLQRAPLRAGYALLLALFGILIAPQVLPVLSLDQFVAYQRLLDFRPIREEQHTIGRIPQQFADMAGWDGLVETIGRAYAALPQPRRAHTAIWTRNYGMAGAVDTLGSAYGLPGAISGHNSYFLWGTRGYSGESVLAVGVPQALLLEEFASVRRVGTFTDPWVLPEENNVALYDCTRPKEPLAAFWPRAKAFI